MELNVKDFERQMLEATQAYGYKGAGEAAKRAMSRALTQGRTIAARSVRQDYMIKQKDIYKGMTIKRPTQIWGGGVIQVKSSTLPLRYFNPRATKKNGVSLTIKRGERKKIKSAFIKPMKSGGVKAVFARGVYDGDGFSFRKKRVKPSGSNDLEITELKTVSIPTALEERLKATDVEDRILEALQKRFEHEISRL